MSSKIEIRPISSSTIQLEEFAIEARESGYDFVDRLIQESKSGDNRFEKKGECFCGIFYGDVLVGCGGINQDPYTDQHIGRLRHIYVLKHARKKGLARQLVLELVNRSKATFNIFRLRAADKDAAKFYDAIGFSRTDDENASHIMRVR